MGRDEAALRGASNAPVGWTPQDYARQRSVLKPQLLAHRQRRTLALGDHWRLQFEDALSLHYQALEILRLERGADADALEAELAQYGAVAPRPGDWTATLLLQVEDAAERAEALSRLRGAEHAMHLAFPGGHRVRARANLDLDETGAQRPSCVHFLRFTLPPACIAAARRGLPVLVGCAHPAARVWREIPPALVAELAMQLPPPAPNPYRPA